MCDTFGCFAAEKHFFAKNSDRNPHEVQVVELRDGSADPSLTLFEPFLPKYQVQLDTLTQAHATFTHPYRALLSRPTWMWGAEMGVNEQGLAIGNEAVFSYLKSEPTGLLGMDILRLALHNAATARQALELISSLLETYGQGGDGAFQGQLFYSNSFFLADQTEMWVLESAKRHWAAKQIKDRGAISNAYSLGRDYDQDNVRSAKVNFARRYANPLVAFFTQGSQRRKTALQMMEKNCTTWHDLRDILLYNRKSPSELDRSMRSLCMDATFPKPSRTTASLVVEYRQEACLAWTAAGPLPCYHPFMPHEISESAFSAQQEQSESEAYQSALRFHQYTEQILAASPAQKKVIAQLARQFDQQTTEILAANQAEPLASQVKAARRHLQSWPQILEGQLPS